MAISESERQQFKRARDRLGGSALDELTLESSYNALSASESALVEPSSDNIATAISKLTLSFAHFASGAPKSATESAIKAIEEHEKNRHNNAGSTTTITTTTPTMPQKLTKWEMVLSAKWTIFAGVCVAAVVICVLYLGILISPAMQAIADKTASSAIEQKKLHK